MLLINYAALGNPTGGSVTQGTATFSTSGTTFNINQTSANAFINWQSFNINASETVNFNQPTIQSVAFNQINDANASQILGNINANGYVILENPNGFFIGGSAVLNAHGLIMTTATPTVNLADGGPWAFAAPPPTAKIQNYGQINITGGGTAYLIAADIVNGGTITAPNGHIGLYDGETVLVSTSPNGEGLSAEVTLPQGSVDNEGKLTANGGSVVAQAQFVNQNGVIQANTAQNVNGTIELLGGSSVTLGASSVISAAGDSTAVSASAGGSVVIQAGTSFSDANGSAITISGATQGGNAGQISILAPQMSAVQSTLNGQAAAGYLNGTLAIDTADIALNASGSPVANALSLNVNAFSPGFSQIDLEASDNIISGAQWVLLPNGGVPTDISLQAGNKIALNGGSGIQANGGNITLKAPTVDQFGTLQANSLGTVNGVIEIDASQSLTLEASSTINAKGDSSSTSASPGGFVVVNAGNIYSDVSGSKISVAGNAAGGQGGIVEIFNPQAGAIKTVVSGAFANLVNPYDMTLSGNSTGTSIDQNNKLDANFNVNDLGNYRQIDLQALDNIELSAAWTLNAVLSLTAGRNITVDSGSGINAQQNGIVNLTAGTGFVPTLGQPTPASGSYGIYLNGAAYLESFTGNINLWAANEVQVGWTGQASPAGTANPGGGSITTGNGGNINVTTLYGDVNTGSGTGGFTYQNTAPYYFISYNNLALGGISTGDGGNVTITAGGNVISYVPQSGNNTISDAGTGAFGTQPGNVTITAGQGIYGHYVLANGVGVITAENGNVGDTATGDPFALSLIKGNWSVNAPNGNIFLTEVRNPNADFNFTTPARRQTAPSGQNVFTYAADAAVDLTAGQGVYLTDSLIPRLSNPGDNFPVVYPPILDITSGANGVTLEGDVTLFPSADQNLKIITTGNFTATSGQDTYLLMSDSSVTSFATSLGGTSLSFTPVDNGAVLPTEFQPVIIDIGGNMGGPDLISPGFNLITSKETEITVGGNLINVGFSGQNLSVNDVTSINVAGQIFNVNSFSFAFGVTIPSIPTEDVPFGLGNSWNDIFALAINPSSLVGLTINQNTPPTQVLDDVLVKAALFQPLTIANGQLIINSQGFSYDANTSQLSFGGQMPLGLEQELTTGTLSVLHLANGQPVLDENSSDNTAGRTFGQYEYDTVTWAPASAIQTLYADSQGALPPTPGSQLPGYRIGGPGQFDVTAGSISLGDSYGILSCGVTDPSGGFGRFTDLAALTPSGATINVTVTDADAPADPSKPVSASNPLVSSLDMLTSVIAALGGGDVNLTSLAGSMDLGSQLAANQETQTGVGVYTSGGGDVSVIALGDVNVNGSRIGTYNGGDIFVESLTGDVNVGSGGNSQNGVYVSYVNPVTKKAANYPETTYGNGIIANTLVPVPPGASVAWPPNVAQLPGNITVLTPQGDIVSSLAGIIQESLSGNFAPGPTVTLTAGTLPSGTPGSPGYIPGFVGNIDLGNSGVIGGDVNLSANGNISGQIVSRQNSTVNAAASFSGTLLAGGSANVSGGGTISGTIVGVGGASVSGGSGVTASVLGQNVSVNGGASQSTLGSSATASSATQSAAQQANSQSQQQANADQSTQDDNNKKKKATLHVSHVTVLLSSAVPH